MFRIYDMHGEMKINNFSQNTSWGRPRYRWEDNIKKDVKPFLQE
jgi:hypothetical protein